MSEQHFNQKFVDLAAKAAMPPEHELTCPKCSEKFMVSPRAIFKETSVTLSLGIAEGHQIQAETLGGMMSNYAKLSKEMARHMGVEIECMISGVRVKDKSYEVDFMMIRAEGKKKRTKRMKTHLLDSSVPLTEGQDQIAICGAQIKQAAFVLMWDEQIVQSGNQLADILGSAIFCCRKCVKTKKELDRYIYGITDGQNVRVGEEA